MPIDVATLNLDEVDAQNTNTANRTVLAPNFEAIKAGLETLARALSIDASRLNLDDVDRQHLAPALRTNLDENFRRIRENFQLLAEAINALPSGGGGGSTAIDTTGFTRVLQGLADSRTPQQMFAAIDALTAGNFRADSSNFNTFLSSFSGQEPTLQQLWDFVDDNMTTAAPSLVDTSKFVALLDGLTNPSTIQAVFEAIDGKQAATNYTVDRSNFNKALNGFAGTNVQEAFDYIDDNVGTSTAPVTPVTPVSSALAQPVRVSEDVRITNFCVVGNTRIGPQSSSTTVDSTTVGSSILNNVLFNADLPNNVGALKVYVNDLLVETHALPPSRIRNMRLINASTSPVPFNLSREASTVSLYVEAETYAPVRRARSPSEVFNFRERVSLTHQNYHWEVNHTGPIVFLPKPHPATPRPISPGLTSLARAGGAGVQLRNDVSVRRGDIVPISIQPLAGSTADALWFSLWIRVSPSSTRAPLVSFDAGALGFVDAREYFIAPHVEAFDRTPPGANETYAVYRSKRMPGDFRGTFYIHEYD